MTRSHSKRKPPPIALQLYSLREALKSDFDSTIEEVARMGYLGVETAGFPEGVSPKAAKQRFDEFGLAVVSAHAPLPLGGEKNMVLETLAAIGCSHLVSPWMDPQYYKTVEGIRQVADLFNQAFETCKAHGLKFSIHNHDFEYQLVDGVPAIELLCEYIEAGISFEVDTYWVRVAGRDPKKVVESLGKRAPLLHIKDGPGVRDEPMLALGEGIMDIPGIIAAGGKNTEWLIVELDRCATDMLTAVEKSCQYLTANGLARGNP